MEDGEDELMGDLEDAEKAKAGNVVLIHSFGIKIGRRSEQGDIAPTPVEIAPSEYELTGSAQQHYSTLHIVSHINELGVECGYGVTAGAGGEEEREMGKCLG